MKKKVNNLFMDQDLEYKNIFQAGKIQGENTCD